MSGADGDRRRWGSSARALAASCHPQPTLAVTALSVAMCAGSGQRAARSALTGAAVLCGQLSIGWANDVLDVDRDRITGRGDKPLAAGLVPLPAARLAAGSALLATIPLSLAVGRRAGLAHLVGVVAGWSYDLGLKGTAVSGLPYTIAFGLLPTLVAGGLPGAPPAPRWATVAGALLGSGAHFANALPDLDADVALGVRGLPHRLGARRSEALAGALVLAATAVIAAAPGDGRPRRDLLARAALPAAALILADGRARGRRPGSRAPFTATIAVAGLAVAGMLARGRSFAPVVAAGS